MSNIINQQKVLLRIYECCTILNMFCADINILKIRKLESVGGGRSTIAVETIAVETIATETITVEMIAVEVIASCVDLEGWGGSIDGLLLRQSLLRQLLLR